MVATSDNSSVGGILDVVNNCIVAVMRDDVGVEESDVTWSRRLFIPPDDFCLILLVYVVLR